MPSLSKEARVAFLPSGAMSSALATKARKNGFRGTLWNHSENSQRYFEANHASKSLPGIPLDGINGTNDIGDALDGAQVVVLAPRSQDFQQVVTDAKPHIAQNALIIIATKGFVEVDGKFLTPSQEVERQMPGARRRIVFLAGPDFAEEFAQGKLSGTTVVARHKAAAKDARTIFHDDLFRVDVYQSNPAVAEAISAYKNVVGLIIGFARTILPEYGENTEALILQKGLIEGATLGRFYGGNPKAIMELFGIGDYGLMMNSITSRNVQGGILFAREEIDVDKLLHGNVTYEGTWAVRAIREIARERRVVYKYRHAYLPLAMTVYRVLYTGRKPKDAMNLVRSLLRQNS